ncbi:hypothetical protein [Methanogenium cariaci]|uniref:zinc ribbon-containing protein n=1 Tax=Methanogenium cariaci TaxID=2197 RepID=UPI0007854C9B|nr:hypothetical protein [Methanogenium cariaci]
MKAPKRVKAGEKVGPGTYQCVDCGLEFAIDESDKDLRKCPTCACEYYNCFPMTHIREDIRTPPEDVRHPPKR